MPGAPLLNVLSVSPIRSTPFAVKEMLLPSTIKRSFVPAASGPLLYVLPNCVDIALLSYRKPPTERLTIGWAGGSSHFQDFAAVKSDLKTFLRRNPDVDMHFIGENYGELVGRPDARYTGWSANLVDYLSKLDFDIGLAPLAYHRFNRSKSDLKFLEYSALGIPVVASDFGPYGESVIHGVTGFLVKHPHEWSRYLRDLVNDDDMRTEMGINAKTWAATRVIQSNYWRWEAAYREVLGRLPAHSGAGASVALS